MNLVKRKAKCIISWNNPPEDIPSHGVIFLCALNDATEVMGLIFPTVSIKINLLSFTLKTEDVTPHKKNN